MAQFAPTALAAGLWSVHAVPLRLRGSVLGALGLFGGQPGPLNAADLMLAQGLDDPGAGRRRAQCAASRPRVLT